MGYTITNTFAEDGKLPEVNHMTNDEFDTHTKQYNKTIREITADPDFDRLQIVYYTQCITIARSDD